MLDYAVDLAVFIMHLLNLVQIRSSLNDIEVSFIPSSDGCNPRARKLGNRGKPNPVKDQNKGVDPQKQED